METTANLGERIRIARKRAGLTTRELGETLGLSAMAVSKWENGQMRPRPDLMPQLAAVLGVKQGWFTRGPTTVTLSGAHWWRDASRD